MLTFKPTFSLSSFTFSKRLFSSSSLSYTISQMMLQVRLVHLCITSKLHSAEDIGRYKWDFISNSIHEYMMNICLNFTVLFPALIVSSHKCTMNTLTFLLAGNLNIKFYLQQASFDSEDSSVLVSGMIGTQHSAVFSVERASIAQVSEPVLKLVCITGQHLYF